MCLFSSLFWNRRMEESLPPKNPKSRSPGPLGCSLSDWASYTWNSSWLILVPSWEAAHPVCCKFDRLFKFHIWVSSRTSLYFFFKTCSKFVFSVIWGHIYPAFFFLFHLLSGWWAFWKAKCPQKMECPLRHKWGAFPNVPLFFFFCFFPWCIH